MVESIVRRKGLVTNLSIKWTCPVCGQSTAVYDTYSEEAKVVNLGSSGDEDDLATSWWVRLHGSCHYETVLLLLHRLRGVPQIRF